MARFPDPYVSAFPLPSLFEESTPFGYQQPLWAGNRYRQSIRALEEEREYINLMVENLRRRYIPLSFPGDYGLPIVSADETTHFHSFPPISDEDPSNPSGESLVLACPDDRGMLNEHLAFLRQQIEFFRATIDDIMLHTRGRNKGVALRQVGVRCRHCSHLSVDKRRKGSTYFPSTLMGIYQAAQNISAEHFQSGICTEIPYDIKLQFERFGATKSFSSGAGKAYWAESARMMGLIDTDDGIRFAADVHVVSSTAFSDRLFSS
jgi:hypothetical protein